MFEFRLVNGITKGYGQIGMGSAASKYFGTKDFSESPVREASNCPSNHSDEGYALKKNVPFIEILPCFSGAVKPKRIS